MPDTIAGDLVNFASCRETKFLGDTQRVNGRNTQSIPFSIHNIKDFVASAIAQHLVAVIKSQNLQ